MSSLDMSLCKELCLLDPTCRRVVFIDPTCRRVVFIRSSFYIAPLFWLSGGWWVFPNFVWASCFSCNVVLGEPGLKSPICNSILKHSWFTTSWCFHSIWPGSFIYVHRTWLGCHRILPGFQQSPFLHLVVSVAVHQLFVPLSTFFLGDVIAGHRSAHSSASIS